ncbi:Coenzyme Q-binding protein coq10, mitochondrial [Elasticomyces elasticus]|nr:Coenzyme Q-binding protein coq10, mitochondrial [Elasticomyces elasticus]
MALRTLRPVSTAGFQTVTRTIPAITCRTAAAFARQQQQRQFSLNPFAGPQTLVATRTLPYPGKAIYDVISDVSNYSKFLPYVQSSTVTKTSQPASNGKTYPEEAKLVIGFNGDVSESFTSRIYCVPETIVEAVSGQTDTGLSEKEIAHHSARSSNMAEDPSRKDTVLTHLATKWLLKPYPYKPPPASAIHPDTTHNNHHETSDLPSEEKCDVTLSVEFAFANPMYAALSSAAAPTVAEKMIDAFEKRVRMVMEGPAHAENDRKGLEGVIKSK